MQCLCYSLSDACFTVLNYSVTEEPGFLNDILRTRQQNCQNALLISRVISTYILFVKDIVTNYPYYATIHDSFPL